MLHRALALLLAAAVLSCAAPLSPRAGVQPQAMGPPPAGEPDLERALLSLINAERRAAGLRPLERDAALVALARAHSADMAEAGFVGHVSPRHGDLPKRLDRGVYLRRLARENVGRAESVESAHQGFMHSPGHRENLLADDVSHLGVGILRAPGPGGPPMLFVTEIFAAPVPVPDAARIREAFVRRVQAERRRGGRPALAREPSLARVLERFATDHRGGFGSRDLGLLGDRAVAALESERSGLRAVEVLAQRVLSEEDLVVPEALVASASAFAVVALEVRSEGGLPRVHVVALIGR